METNKDTKYYAGFDLGGSSLKYGYGNIEEGLKFFKTKNHEEKTLEALKQILKDAYDDITNSVIDSEIKIEGLGMATPGIVNNDTVVVLGSTPNLPFLKGLNLKELLEEITNVPVAVENDANLMTLAESINVQEENILGITIGSGIGTGFVHKKRIFKGEHYKAMEAGHMIIKPNGRLCLCGKKGCVEAYSSADSMKKIIGDQFPEFKKLPINEILKLTDFRIKLILRELQDVLAHAIANLIVVLDPGIVFIGGGIIETESYDFKYLKNQINAFLSNDYKNFTVKKAVLGNRAGVMGGVMLSHCGATASCC